MLGVALGFTVLMGLPLGVLLYLTGQRQLLASPLVYRVLSVVVNVLRSMPFIILLIVLIPVTTRSTRPVSASKTLRVSDASRHRVNSHVSGDRPSSMQFRN